MKRALVKEQLKISAAELLDARSIVDWCSLALSQGGTLVSMVGRFFWLVEEGSIADRSNCAIVRDLSKMHSFRSSDSSTWTIWTRQLASFCPSCFQCDWDNCESSEWVDTWAPHYLTSLSIIPSIRNDDMESSLEHNHLLDLL